MPKDDRLIAPLFCQQCGAPLTDGLTCRYCGTPHERVRQYEGPELYDRLQNFGAWNGYTMNSTCWVPGSFDAIGRYIGP